MQDFCCFVFVFNLQGLYQIYLYLSNNSHLPVDHGCHLCFLPWNRMQGRVLKCGCAVSGPTITFKVHLGLSCSAWQGTQSLLGKTCAFSKLQIFPGKVKWGNIHKTGLKLIVAQQRLRCKPATDGHKGHDAVCFDDCRVVPIQKISPGLPWWCSG